MLRRLVERERATTAPLFLEIMQLECRDSGNDLRFPDFASHTDRFCLNLFVSPPSYLFRLISDNYPFY